ncbi:variable surface protein [Plasmodium gonderi]|uniref:Variable surface protein n=1 Tax=Plasmodium gonderi TaxID=77519 RepID=A0A1Y1JA70_PLAGO|nr:variable surface protein [Plasmodium gonderi]GAW79411.1 variable surface protein [Plasmodium gonderi]
METQSNREWGIFISKIVDIVQDINRRVLGTAPCECFFSGEFEQWVKEKDLHDFFKNIDKIKIGIESDIDKHDLYLKYLTYINSLYEEEKDECCDKYDIFNSDCPTYFTCNPDRDTPNDLIKQIKKHSKASTHGRENVVVHAETSIESTRLGSEKHRDSPGVAFLVQPITRADAQNQNVKPVNNGWGTLGGFLFSLFGSSRSSQPAPPVQEKLYPLTVTQKDEDCSIDMSQSGKPGSCKKEELDTVDERETNFLPPVNIPTENADNIVTPVSSKITDYSFEYSHLRLGIWAILLLGLSLIFYTYIKHTNIRYFFRKKKTKRTRCMNNIFDEDNSDVSLDYLNIYMDNRRLYWIYHSSFESYD